MNARDDCYESDWEGYEPDDEDLAYDLYKERELESYRIDYAYIDRELRDYRNHTDRQLRQLSKERKAIARDCKLEHEFDVADDTYEVHLDSETSITMPHEGLRRDEAPPPLTRKDKRRLKKDQRTAKRFLRNFDERREKSCTIISG